MPRIIPEPRYFSMPSIDVGADVRMKRALNCWPWVWSLTHSPDAVIHSPAAMMAAWPMTVTRSRWPRAFARSTQKPFSLLWKVTRSTRPASTSWVDGTCGGFIDAASAGASPGRVGWMDEIVVTGWKKAFDGDPVGREKSGVRRYRILRPIDDANDVMIDLEFSNHPTARGGCGHTFEVNIVNAWPLLPR